MKKLLILFLTGAICMSFVACGNAGEPQTNNDDTQIELEEELSETEEYTDTALIGTWKGYFNFNLSAPVTMVLNEDGTGSWETTTSIEELTWQTNTCLKSPSDKIVKVDLCTEHSGTHSDFDIVTEDGVIKLNLSSLCTLEKQ